MAKKLGFASLLYGMRETWPSCGQPKTSSFRKEDDSDEVRNAMKSSYFQFSSRDNSWLSNSSVMDTECEIATDGDSTEAIVRGLQSERLFFEPGSNTSSIVSKVTGKRAGDDEISFEGSIAMALDSEDPYRDFKVSMEEMVMAHGVKNWEWLEGMLVWYLRANGKSSHDFIVGAFLDLLMSIASTSSSSLSCSTSYCSSSCTTFEIEEDEVGG